MRPLGRLKSEFETSRKCECSLIVAGVEHSSGRTAAACIQPLHSTRDGASHSWSTTYPLMPRTMIAVLMRCITYQYRMIDRQLTIEGWENGLSVAHGVGSCESAAQPYLMPESVDTGSHWILRSHRIPEMRVGHVCRVDFTKLSSQPFLLFFGDATLKSLLVAATILPHIVASPDNDQQEFES